MKTLTIEHSMVETLDSDDSKLEFINSIITLLTDGKTANNSLSNGLNVDLPEPLDGAPVFDSKNMGVTEVRRFYMLQAGHVPVSLDCGYADYKYKDIRDMSDDELFRYLICVNKKIKSTKDKRNFLNFLNHIQLTIKTYCINTDRESLL